MKALSLNIQKLWPVLTIFCGQTDRAKTLCPQSIDALGGAQNLSTLKVFEEEKED